MKSHCRKCGMSFEIGSGGCFERLVCPEKGCGRTFWSGRSRANAQTARVGMSERQVEAFRELKS